MKGNILLALNYTVVTNLNMLNHSENAFPQFIKQKLNICKLDQIIVMFLYPDKQSLRGYTGVSCRWVGWSVGLLQISCPGHYS